MFVVLYERADKSAMATINRALLWLGGRGRENRTLQMLLAQAIEDLAAEIAHDADVYQRREPLRDPSLRNAQ